MKYPLNKNEWKWRNGGTLAFTFENLKTGETHTIELEDKIEVSLDTLYSLIENIDHSGILENPDIFDLKWAKENLDELRETLKQKWKEKFTGDLPHL